MTTRRKFIRQAVGTSLAASALTGSAASYTRVLGANDRVNAVVMGMGGRGKQLLQDFIDDGNVSVVGLCDADSRRVMEGQATLAENDQGRAAGGSDIRKILDDTNADVLVIATPDHWHAPGALIGMDAGLHVYLEKPVGHSPLEGELLIESQAKHGKILQVGNQQRSALESRDLIARIRAGELGDIYRVYTWYANNRGSIGNGKQASPPDWLDWEQWQGPAPRRGFQDNVVHYNWHWFWRWGTGETCNNAMHELDIARWAIGADYPDRVSVTASRQFFREDDWEMYDTMLARFRFGSATVEWESHSCNRVRRFGRGRGTLIYGTRGSALVGRNGYTIFNLGGETIAEKSAAISSETTGLAGGGPLNRLHIDNFLDTVRGIGNAQHSPIAEGHKSTLLCHLANMAYRTGETLHCDPTSGKPHNKSAATYWSRSYEPGWEPTI